MGMGFAPTWLRQVSPLLYMTTLTTDQIYRYTVYLIYHAFVPRLSKNTFSTLVVNRGIADVSSKDDSCCPISIEIFEWQIPCF